MYRVSRARGCGSSWACDDISPSGEDVTVTRCLLSFIVSFAVSATFGLAQDAPRPRQQVPVDNGRALRLYVPTDPQWQSVGRDFTRDIAERERDDARYEEVCKGRVAY